MSPGRQYHDPTFHFDPQRIVLENALGSGILLMAPARSLGQKIQVAMPTWQDQSEGGPASRFILYSSTARRAFQRRRGPGTSGRARAWIYALRPVGLFTLFSPLSDSP